MALIRTKTSLLVFLLLLIYLSSAKGFRENMKPVYSLRKGGIQMNLRKLLVLDTVSDYDYTGPNPKHDPSPKKGKPGKNP